VKVYWCAHCGAGRNFGDQLTPLLLAHFGIPFSHAPGPEADLVMVGSVLSAVPNYWRGTILGTGFIQAGMKRDLRRARAIACRGEWTRRAARLPPSTPLGDLGVLAPLLADGRTSPPVPQLVLAHYVDHDLIEHHPGAAVIPITAEPAAIIAAVTAAGVVFTSSLHGLILADALGIPHVWEKHADVRGDGFKFADYASALDEVIRPGRERLSDRRTMLDLQRRAAGWIGTLQTARSAA
jgi:pyruvyltransferase